MATVPPVKAVYQTAAEPSIDPTAYVLAAKDGLSSLNLIIDSIHCPSCIRLIEGNLKKLPGIKSARVNLSTKRLFVLWDEALTPAKAIIHKLDELDFPPTPFNPALLTSASEKEDKALLRAMGVAGFAAANVMLLSVAVWSGTDEMGPATRDLMHWVSALIALPTVAYSGQPFFRSAFAALKARSLNMDVPISLAVLLAVGMSVSETLQSAKHAYFDASVMLLFFLLIGRYLDRRMRSRAQSAAQNLLSLRAIAATVINEDGSRTSLPVEAIETGMKVAIAVGEKVPVDGRITSGKSELDTSLVTGESLPQIAETGDVVFAGTLNLAAPIEVKVTARDDQTLLSEIVRLMETAEQGRAKYVQLADRAAQIYAPAVHLLSALTFAGWWILGDGGWHPALMNAVAVLIITCPCALGLAVPTVQVVASGLLLKRGILVKAADGLERLADADAVVFDKTGTLTEGKPALINQASITENDLQLAASLALHSKHPLSKAVLKAFTGKPIPLTDIHEEAGQGLEGYLNNQRIRIGNRHWCGLDQSTDENETVSELWLSSSDNKLVRFTFTDRLRDDAVEAVALSARYLGSAELLSGDRKAAVTLAAKELGLKNWRAEANPKDKIIRLEELARENKKVLMIGDGLNDAPALATAFVSASPATASDISQTAADFVFQGNRLKPMIEAIAIARKAKALIFQNFGLAILYNTIAVPLAMAGYVTPLIAALAMSGSSIIVTLNALRLRLSEKES
ncbi:cation-translocating P-type ATPase [Kiloniella laminariae]|uniref:Cation-translocating P-type ATPase n=1 Tax=Kiloniella laminariae TaxID=454162 RepID=A0ABT4LG82_9PROT|nr:cation-translocating P-type ATPase [Kiloniella laminariae]MCZ4280114.1 cation-translocating P-type ATPase [Kiloniella laminariae]